MVLIEAQKVLRGQKVKIMYSREIMAFSREIKES